MSAKLNTNMESNAKVETPCKECTRQKLECTREAPTCHNCEREGKVCIYPVQTQRVVREKKATNGPSGASAAFPTIRPLINNAASPTTSFLHQPSSEAFLSAAIRSGLSPTYPPAEVLASLPVDSMTPSPHTSLVLPPIAALVAAPPPLPSLATDWAVSPTTSTAIARSVRLEGKTCNGAKQAALTQTTPRITSGRLTSLPALPPAAIRLMATRRARKDASSPMSPTSPAFGSSGSTNDSLAPAALSERVNPSVLSISNEVASGPLSLHLLPRQAAAVMPYSSPFGVLVPHQYLVPPPTHHPYVLLSPGPTPEKIPTDLRLTLGTSELISSATSPPAPSTIDPALAIPTGDKPLALCVLTGPPINTPYNDTPLPDYTIASINLNYLRARISESETWDASLGTGPYQALHAEVLAKMNSYMAVEIIDDLGAQACFDIRSIYVKGALPAVKRMEEDPASIRQRAAFLVQNVIRNAKLFKADVILQRKLAVARYHENMEEIAIHRAEAKKVQDSD